MPKRLYIFNLTYLSFKKKLGRILKIETPRMHDLKSFVV